MKYSQLDIPDILLMEPQGKLVRVISGEVFDLAVDIRKSSFVLSQKDKNGSTLESAKVFL